jgi:hypothetical protein
MRPETSSSPFLKAAVTIRFARAAHAIQQHIRYCARVRYPGLTNILNAGVPAAAALSDSIAQRGGIESYQGRHKGSKRAYWPMSDADLQFVASGGSVVAGNFNEKTSAD